MHSILPYPYLAQLSDDESAKNSGSSQSNLSKLFTFFHVSSEFEYPFSNLSIPALQDDGMKEFIINQTQCKPYSGAGICPRVKQKTTILRSVDNTYYYADNLNDVRNVKYTLFGHYGDQVICQMCTKPSLPCCLLILNTLILAFVVCQNSRSLKQKSTPPGFSKTQKLGF